MTLSTAEHVYENEDCHDWCLTRLTPVLALFEVLRHQSLTRRYHMRLRLLCPDEKTLENIIFFLTREIVHNFALCALRHGDLKIVERYSHFRLKMLGPLFKTKL